MQVQSTPAFILDNDPTVDWPVTVRLPVSGGRFEDFGFIARIRVLSEDEYADLRAASSKPEAGAEAAGTKPLREVLEENAYILPKVVVGWGPEVRDTAGQPVPFSTELLAAQLRGRYGQALSSGLWTAINQIRFGITPDQPGALEGNAVPAPGSGSSSPEAQGRTN